MRTRSGWLLAVGLLSAAGTWALVTSFQGAAMVLLGVAALAAGALLLTECHTIAALFCLLALPGATAVQLATVVDDIPEWETLITGGVYDFRVRLPFASQARATMLETGGIRFFLNVDCDWNQFVDWRSVKIVDLKDEVFGRWAPDSGLFLLRFDRETSWRQAGSLLGFLSEHDVDEVAILVRKYATSFDCTREEAARFGATEHFGRPWPGSSLRVRFRVAESDEGLLRIEPTETRMREFRYRRDPGSGLVTTAVRYRCGGSWTRDFEEVARHIADRRPRGIAPSDDVAWVFVVAVINQLHKAGVDPIDVARFPELTAAERKADAFPLRER